MKLKEARERLALLGPELKKLGELDTRTAEQEAELTKLMAEFDELAPLCERLINAERMAAQAATYAQSTGRVSSILPGEQNGSAAGASSAVATIDRRPIGQRFAESDAIAEWLKAGGKSSDRFGLGGLLNPNPRRVQYSKENAEDGDALTRAGGRDNYTLITTEDTPAYMVPAMVMPGIARGRDYALTMRDVLVNGTTNSDTIYFLRELLFTNAAAETAQASSFNPAALAGSGTKPESALTFEQASAPVVTIAHWIPITRQAIADAAQLQTYVESRLLIGLARRLNSQILNGAGGGTNMTGILNTSGIQTLDAAYFAANAVLHPDTDNENFERIARAKTLVDTVGDALATFVTLNPADIELLMTSADANRQYFGGGPMSSSAFTVWGLPVASERAIAEGTALVGDGTAAIVWDREDANILIDTINDQFIKNMLTILAELRAALTVIRPAAFVEVELVAA